MNIIRGRFYSNCKLYACILDVDSLSLLIRGWMTPRSGISPQLHLHIDQKTVIRCDAVETMLDPSVTFPVSYAKQFMVTV